MPREHEWHNRYRHKLSRRLYQELGGRAEDEPIPVIVIMRDDVPRHDREIHDRVCSLGGEIRRELSLIRAFSTVLPARALAEVGPHEKVRRLHLDRKCRPCLDVGVPSVYADMAQAAGVTGRGVTIAVLDSGIDPHPDFLRPKSRLAAWQDMVNNNRQPYDDNGHGTHVAGIIAGNGYASGGRYRGMAPEAEIVAVKVADEKGETPMSRLIEGLQWVVENKDRYNIRVVNLSLGAEPGESYREDPLCLAVERVWGAGVVVVAAAGNEGPKPKTIDTPGNDPVIITVGAVDDEKTVARRDDRVPGFSSRGPTNDGLGKPDLLAPGVGIFAPRPGGGYISRTGTSMSTAFVTGAAALLLSRNPDLTPDQVKTKLRASAERLRLPSTVQGAGYLNVQKLIGIKGKTESAARRRFLPPAARDEREEEERKAAARALLRQAFKRQLLGWGVDLLSLSSLMIVTGVLI